MWNNTEDKRQNRWEKRVAVAGFITIRNVRGGEEWQTNEIMDWKWININEIKRRKWKPK